MIEKFQKDFRKFRKDREKMVGHFCVNLLITSWSLAGLWHDWSFKRTFISLGRIEIKKMVDGWTFFVLFTSWSPAGLWLTWEHLDRARSGSGTEWPSVSRWSVGSSDRSSAPGSHRTRYVPTPSEPAEKRKEWLAIVLFFMIFSTI